MAVLGGWNGLAQGFQSGLNSGTQMAEVRLRREALMKEQINEVINASGTRIENMLKGAGDTIAAQAQWSPQLETVKTNAVEAAMETAQMLRGLGPQGEQAAQYYENMARTIPQQWKTMSDVNTEENVAKVRGAETAADRLLGQQTATPAAPTTTPGAPIDMAGPGMPPDIDTSLLGSTAGASPAPSEGSAPAMQGAQGQQVAQAAQVDPRRQQLIDQFLGNKGGDAKVASADKMRIALIETGISRLSAPVSDQKNSENLEDFLKKPSKWSALQYYGAPGKIAGDELGRAMDGLNNMMKAAHYALTGQAATDSETKALAGPFTPSMWDTDKAAGAKIEALKEFAGRAMAYARSNGEPISRDQALMLAGSIAATHGLDSTPRPGQAAAQAGSTAEAGESEVPSFNSEEEAAAAGLPDGTPIIVNGVKGKWRN